MGFNSGALVQGTLYRSNGGRNDPVASAAVYFDPAPTHLSFPADKTPRHVRFSGGRFSEPQICVQAGQPIALGLDGKGHGLIIDSRHERPAQSILTDAPEVKFSFRHPVEVATVTVANYVGAYLIVTVAPNPCFAMTDQNGRFKLPHRLPPGAYSLRFYAKDLGREKCEFTVPPDAKEVGVTHVYPPG